MGMKTQMLTGGRAETGAQLPRSYRKYWLPFPGQEVLSGLEQGPQSLALSLPGLFVCDFHKRK